MTDQLPTIGRTVHFVMDSGRSRGEHRPAVIVRVWGEDQVKAGTLPESALGTVQLQVFVDGTNDGFPEGVNVVWKTSVKHDEGGEPYSWHWPEQIDETGAFKPFAFESGKATS